MLESWFTSLQPRSDLDVTVEVEGGSKRDILTAYLHVLNYAQRLSLLSRR